MIIHIEVNLKSSKLLSMTIGQVAKEAGLTASAIRFYEQAGVLPKPLRIGGRSSGGRGGSDDTDDLGWRPNPSCPAR